MIAPHTARQIRRLLAKGRLSQRKIAAIAGVSRGTVGAIAAGKRADYPEQTTPAPGPESDLCQAIGPRQRCPGCGGMVEMPCRLCLARAIKANATRSSAPFPSARVDTAGNGVHLGLDLKEEHRARYEEVHARRAVAEHSALRPADENDERPEEDEPVFDNIDLADSELADLFDEQDFENLDDLEGLWTATA